MAAGVRPRWKKKFGEMDVSDARRLKQLEDENRRLKKLVTASDPVLRDAATGNL
jgi:putative transposase